MLLTPNRTFSLDDLAKVLCYQNERFSILYNKYFYGFEKEGKSAYFLENAVEGFYFNYRYPFKEDFVGRTLTQGLNTPLTSSSVEKSVRLKTDQQIEEEEMEKENH